MQQPFPDARDRAHNEVDSGFVATGVSVESARWRMVTAAAVVVALLMLLFESVKSVIWPDITIWESHTITIVFSTMVATFATWAAVRRSDQLHARLLREQGERVLLQERSNHLHERTVELERLNDRLALEIEHRRQVEQQLVHAQKMESIGRLAGGIAHDLNNLLSVIITGIDLAKRDVASGSAVQADLDGIRDASMRAARLTRQLLTFARHQPHEPLATDLHDLLTGAMPVIRRLVGETVDVELSLDATHAIARVDPTQIDQVIFNLVTNAADAMPGGGRLRLGTRNGFSAASGHHAPSVHGAWIAIEVADTGAGIATDVLPRLFEPFFTTKPVGKGTGLGLATAYGIVTRSGGTIEAHNNPAGGATFRVTFPVVDVAPVLTDDVASPGARSSRAAKILLAEDEPAVRDVAQRVLTAAGYQVILATDGEDALIKSGDWNAGPDLLLTDVVMPKLGGRALALQLRAQFPRLPVLFMSGYTDSAVIGDGLGNAHFLQKPFAANVLLDRVAAALKGPDLPADAA